jgi:sugar phosphate isomerase/epimerase
MQRVISTYLYISQRLTPALLAEIEREFRASQMAASPAQEIGVEIFCKRDHFDYRSPQSVRELADWFHEHPLKLHSLHAPTSRDTAANRETASPISICDAERVRRLDAVDEIKRALEVADTIPFRFMVLHLGGREPMTEARKKAAFSSLEHLAIFAKQRGVTIALENTPGALATPSNLRHFLRETKLRDLRLCFDAGHAHLDDGVTVGYETMRDLVVTTHLHDNRGETDEHLLPGEGTIDWETVMRAMAGSPAARGGLPLVMELKEPTMPGVTPTMLLQLAIALFERLERWLALGKAKLPV